MFEDKAQLPGSLYSLFGTAFTVLHPSKQSRIMYPSKGCWKVITHEEQYYTVRESIGRGNKKMQEAKYARYTDDEFCSVGPNDLVVDVGAFLGEFSLAAARHAGEVLAIEPDPKSFRCLSLQTADRDNIIVLNELPLNERTTLSFKSATDGSESSVINVDRGEYEEVEILAKPLDDIFAEQGITHVDFMKIDAEGAEPEVLRGLQETKVDKLVIDVGKERNGAGTENEVREILEDRGYDCRVKSDQNEDDLLFAVLKNTDSY